MRALGLLPAWLLAMAPAAFAQDAALPPRLERAVYQLLINGRDAGTTEVLLGRGDIWMPAIDLDRAGLRWTSARQDAGDGVPRVALSSLTPHVVVTRDDVNVTLRIDAPAEAFGRVTSFAPARATPERLRRAGGFLNYSLSGSRLGSPAFATELGISASNVLVRSTWSGKRGNALVRGGTTVSFDHEPTLVRWEAGDTLGRAGASAGVVPLAGVSVSRQFGMSAGLVSTSSLAVSGATAVPATAEVYVNGQLVSRTAVEPGAFELRDLIAPVGAGDVQLVLRDQFGRVTASTTQFYRSPRVLRRGLQEFRYAAGSPRVDAVQSQWRYRGVAVFGEHRLGLTDSLTVGGEFARTTRGAAGALAIATQSRAGELEIGLGLSRAADRAGRSLSALYAFRSRMFGVQVSARSRSASYTEVAPDAFRAAPRIEGDLAGSVTIWRGIGLSATTALGRLDDGWRERSGLSTHVGLRGGASLAVGVVASREPGRRHGFGVLTTLSLSLNARTSASVGAQAGAAGPRQMGASLQRSLPLGPGVGYRVQARDGGSAIVSAQFEAQGRAGRVELRHDMFGGAASDSASVSGAIAVIGGDVHLSRAISDAFALVRVSRVGGVRTYLSNQFVGRTDRAGELLVPSLASYQANRLSIDERDVPLSYDVGSIESVVAPGLRGGSVVTFRVRELRLIEGRFALPAAGDDDTTSTASVHWPAGSEQVTVDRSGAFAFERAAAGRHDAVVVHQGQTYRCTIALAPSASAMDNLGIEMVGDVPCTLDVTTTPADAKASAIKGGRR